MRDVLKRIEALEQSARSSSMPFTQAIHFVAIGEEWNPQKAYRDITNSDDDPRTLHRQPGESVEAFEKRAAMAFPTGLHFLV